MITTCSLNRNKLKWYSRSQEHVLYVKAGDVVYDDEYIYIHVFSREGEKIDVIDEEGTKVCTFMADKADGKVLEGLRYHPIYGAGFVCSDKDGKGFYKYITDNNTIRKEEQR